MKRAVLFAALVGAAGCGATPSPRPAPPSVALPPAVPEPTAKVETPAVPATTPDVPFRQHPPEPGPSKPFVLPVVSRFQLHNGIPVVFVPWSSYLVAVRVAATEDPADGTPPEAVGLLLEAMGRATTTRSPSELRGEYARLMAAPAELGHSNDGYQIGIAGRSSNLVGIVDLIAEVALRSAIDAESLERARFQRASGRVDPEATSVADAVLARVLFEGHPYARREAWAKPAAPLRLDEVRQLYARAFVPSRLHLVIAGDVTEDQARAALESAFGGLPVAKPAPLSGSRVRPPTRGARIVLVDRPGVQPVVSAGFVGPAAGDRDDVAVWATVDQLGDGVQGSLTKRLRDELGLVPWLSDVHYFERLGGLLSFRTRADVERVPAVLKEIDAALRAASTTPVAEDVLSLWREQRQSGFASGFVSTAGMTRTYAFTELEGLPPSRTSDLPSRFSGLTPADVQHAAATWLDPTKMRVVVVGDASALQGPLEALGWGPVERRTIDGDVVKGAPGAKR